MLHKFFCLFMLVIALSCGPSRRSGNGTPTPGPHPSPGPTPIGYMDVNIAVSVESPTPISSDASYKISYKSVNEAGKVTLLGSTGVIVAHKVPIDNQSAELKISISSGKNYFESSTQVILDKKDYQSKLKFKGMKFYDVTVTVPDAWTIFQKANNDDTLILNLKVAENEFVTFYAKDKIGLDFNSVLVNDAKVEKPQETKVYNDISWKVVGTSKGSNFIYGFMAEINGKTYFGYAKATSMDKALSNGEAILKTLKKYVSLGSLTDEDFTGKKYYIGFGDKLDGEMGNEVLYDIKHTHDIFVNKVGGDYIGQTFDGDNASAEKLKQGWAELKTKIKPEDMYVQYSSGHGYNGGVAFGVTMDEIRDNALSYNAKETIIFLMACESGSLIDSFNAKKSEWENFQTKGRTVLAFASSKTGENSSTGPGTDPDEPNGPDGSAGSAYGHSLWKAFIGYSDGYVDGVKDGFISLDEILQFTIWKTQQVGGHTPVYTGSFNPQLIMNRVPPKAWLDSLEHGTEELSDSEVMEQIQGLNNILSVERGE